MGVLVVVMGVLVVVMGDAVVDCVGCVRTYHTIFCTTEDRKDPLGVAWVAGLTLNYTEEGLHLHTQELVEGEEEHFHTLDLGEDSLLHKKVDYLHRMEELEDSDILLYLHNLHN